MGAFQQDTVRHSVTQCPLVWVRHTAIFFLTLMDTMSPICLLESTLYLIHICHNYCLFIVTIVLFTTFLLKASNIYCATEVYMHVYMFQNIYYYLYSYVPKKRLLWGKFYSKYKYIITYIISSKIFLGENVLEPNLKK